MKLCVFAFEGHFRVMQLAILQAIKNMPIDNVEIFWDDAECPVPQGLPWPVTPYSSFADVKQFGRGWIRQQFAKLCLHRILTDNEWIVMDADVVLRNPYDFSANQWYIDPREGSNEYWQFMKYAFNIDPSTERWMTALWKCEREVLMQMEQDLLSWHGFKFETVFVHSGAPVLSEVETYAYYATQQANRKFERLNIGTRMITGAELATAWSESNEDLCLSGRDDDIDVDFLRQWPEIIVDIK